MRFRICETIDAVSRQPLLKVVFGGVLSAASLLNLMFGWFRAFDWLQKNAPPVWKLLVNPGTQYTLIFVDIL